MDQPYQHAMYSASAALEAPRWHYKEKLAVVDAVTPADLNAFAPRLLRRFFCETLVHGNCGAEQALVLAGAVDDVLAPLPLAPSQQPAPRRVALTRGRAYRHRFDETNAEQVCSAVRVYFDCGRPWDRGFGTGGPGTGDRGGAGDALEAAERGAAVVQLLMKIVSEPCYDQLRTKEQLGYLVWSGTATQWRPRMPVHRAERQGRHRLFGGPCCVLPEAVSRAARGHVRVRGARGGGARRGGAQGRGARAGRRGRRGRRGRETRRRSSPRRRRLSRPR